MTSEVKTLGKSKDPLQGPQIPELSPTLNHSQVGSSADSFSTTQIETEENYADCANLYGVAYADDGSRVVQTADNYVTETKATDNNVSSGMIPKEIETLIRELGDRVDKMESEDYLYSVLWNFAGESVYYETHQLSLTSRAVYWMTSVSSQSSRNEDHDLYSAFVFNMHSPSKDTSSCLLGVYAF